MKETSESLQKLCFVSEEYLKLRNMVQSFSQTMKSALSSWMKLPEVDYGQHPLDLLITSNSSSVKLLNQLTNQERKILLMQSRNTMSSTLKVSNLLRCVLAHLLLKVLHSRSLLNRKAFTKSQRNTVVWNLDKKMVSVDIHLPL